MKLRKINEVVDHNNDLIGKDDIPTHGSDLESKANNTTDYNANISRQPYRYDMLGRFGFTLFPFFEGEGDENKNEMMDKINEVIFQKYMDILQFYYKNPQKLKNNFRKYHKSEYNDVPENIKSDIEGISNKIMETLKPFLENIVEAVDQSINESEVKEDKVVDQKNTRWIEKKDDDKEVLDKDIKKIAGFLNKLDKEDLESVVKLLEV